MPRAPRPSSPPAPPPRRDRAAAAAARRRRRRAPIGAASARLASTRAPPADRDEAASRRAVAQLSATLRAVARTSRARARRRRRGAAVARSAASARAAAAARSASLASAAWRSARADERSRPTLRDFRGRLRGATRRFPTCVDGGSAGSRRPARSRGRSHHRPAVASDKRSVRRVRAPYYFARRSSAPRCAEPPDAAAACRRRWRARAPSLARRGRQSNRDGALRQHGRSPAVDARNAHPAQRRRVEDAGISRRARPYGRRGGAAPPAAPPTQAARGAVGGRAPRPRRILGDALRRALAARARPRTRRVAALVGASASRTPSRRASRGSARALRVGAARAARSASRRRAQLAHASGGRARTRQARRRGGLERAAGGGASDRAAKRERARARRAAAGACGRASRASGGRRATPASTTRRLGAHARHRRPPKRAPARAVAAVVAVASTARASLLAARSKLRARSRPTGSPPRRGRGSLGWGDNLVADAAPRRILYDEHERLRRGDAAVSRRRSSPDAHTGSSRRDSARGAGTTARVQRINSSATPAAFFSAAVLR